MGGCVAKGSASAKAERSRKRLSVDNVESTASCDVVESQAQADGAEEEEEDRQLLVRLDAQQLLEMVRLEGVAPLGRRFSVGTETDANMNRVNSFCSKTARLEGDNYVPESECIGYSCKKGLKPEAPNQDSFLVCKVDDIYSIYAVFDGHGRKGHDISNFVKEHLPKLLVGNADILKDPIKVLTTAFDTTQRLIEHATNSQRIDANRSGTTASVVLHDHKQNMLYLAHVGDSRVVLAKRDPRARSEDKEWHAVDLTEDHKPNLPAEKARIESQGGQVIFDGGYNYRVYAKGKRYPGLNMSRAMGDLKGFHDAGISAVPDIAGRPIAGRVEQLEPERVCSPVSVGGNSDGWPLSPKLLASDYSPDRLAETRSTNSDRLGFESAEVTSCTSIKSASSCAPSVTSQAIDPASDKFLLICSDGVWEFMTSEEGVATVAAFKPHEAMHAAETLASCAWDRWMQHMHGEVVDDITALVIHLDHRRTVDSPKVAIPNGESPPVTPVAIRSDEVIDLQSP